MPQIVVLPHVEYCPEGAVIEAKTGTSICDALLGADIEIEHACEKSCACTTCHVVVREGFDSLEEAWSRVRACRARPGWQTRISPSRSRNTRSTTPKKTTKPYGAVEREPIMKWNDIQQIAEALYDKYPDVDPTRLNFVDLHNKVVGLEGFDDDHKRGGEKFLEAIQQAWIDEAAE
jgi:FeS assembly protein IscX